MKTRNAFLVIVLSLATAFAQASEQRLLTVFAAASLTDSLQQVSEDFTKRTGIAVRHSFAASSALAKQIDVGARADIFFSADQEWMDYLERRELIASATRRELLHNRLALVALRDSDTSVDLAQRNALVQALGRSGRLAVGDPDSVPAGKYAKRALTALNLWSGLESRLARAENVRVALMYVARGEAPLGIVYSTDARVEPRVRIVALFPESSHAPITYPVAATRNASSLAAQYLAYLQSDAAREIFERAGFIVGTTPN